MAATICSTSAISADTGNTLHPAASAPRRGALKIATTNLRAGYLRKNGVPYSEDAKLTEYFDVIGARNGLVLLMVTAIGGNHHRIR